MPTAATDLNRLMRQAEAAFGARAFDEAERILALLRKAAPHQFEVLHLSALVARRREQPAEARRFFEAALRRRPHEPEVLTNFANLLGDEGDGAAALAFYDQALAAAPAFAAARINKAATLQRLGRHQEALAVLAALKPATSAAAAQADTMRGSSLLALERLAEAGEAFDRALRQQPDRTRTLAGRGMVALQRGEHGAGTWFRRVLDVSPGDRQSALHLAEALEAEGDSAALQILEQTVTANPDWAEGHRVLARMRWEAGLASSHVEILQAELRRQPRNAELWTVLVQALATADCHEQAAAAAGQAGKLCGEELFLAAEAAELSEAGDLERATAAFERCREQGHGPTIADVRHRLRIGDPGRAQQLVDVLLAAEPWAVQAWAYQSLLWRMTGDEREAWLHGQPGLVAAAELVLDDGEVDAIAAHLRTLHRTRAHPLGQSLRGGTQTRGRLLEREEPLVQRLRSAISTALAAHVRGLPPHDPAHPLLRHRDGAFRLAGSWSVRLAHGGFHVAHVHSRGILSSACYLAVPERLAPGEGALEVGGAPAELEFGVSPVASFQPEPGRMVLFPSTLFHGTQPFPAGERLTAAFDVVVD